MKIPKSHPRYESLVRREKLVQGWREGIVESKAMGLYRQQYCGCIYSERERYQSLR